MKCCAARKYASAIQCRLDTEVCLHPLHQLLTFEWRDFNEHHEVLIMECRSRNHQAADEVTLKARKVNQENADKASTHSRKSPSPQSGVRSPKPMSGVRDRKKGKS